MCRYVVDAIAGDFGTGSAPVEEIHEPLRHGDDAVAATSVECVAPASRVGRVPLGVSLARSNEASFGEDVEYQYF